MSEHQDLHSNPPLRAGSSGCGCSSACQPGLASDTRDDLQTQQPPGEVLRLHLPAMDCPTEEGQIRRALERFTRIRRLSFDLPARSLSIEAPVECWDDIEAAIGTAGFKAERLVTEVQVDKAALARAQFLRPVAALAVAMMAEAIAYISPEALLWKLVGMAVAGIAIALSGLSVFRKGVAALARGQLNINALMSVAVAGAFVIGQWPEAAMVMALYAIAELIEARAVERARDAIKSLLDLSPQEAEVLQDDGEWRVMLAKEVAVGTVVRVRPGERLALDGMVRSGRSAVDQSPVTGESMPVEKEPGDAVFAGTINQDAALEFEVTAPATDSVLARIIHAVEVAEGSRAPTQRFVDRFAAIYTPVVFVLALGLALAGPLLFGWAWLSSVYKALVILVIACPCALVISTPVTVVSGLAAATRRGILIKGGVYLEEARKLRAVALDKTGTVTEGRPRLVATVMLRDMPDEAATRRIAAALASRSDHPVSRAIASSLAVQGVPDVTDFGAEAGRGVFGQVDGHDYVLGNHRWIHERNQCSATLESLMSSHEQQGRTITVLADAGQPLALFAVADTVKASSREAIAELAVLGVRPVMLTGDNPATASSIAAEVGIDDVRANLLPQEKLDAIRRLADSGTTVAMVGDGINDAPALATASIGFAMGGMGTHTAMEAADIVIMNDDLRRVPETIRLSQRTHAILWQNITLALGIKLVFLFLAIFDSATMWMAVFADMGASLLVVGNGLRLLRGSKTGGRLPHF